ncbi:SRPBCC family protein [Parvularcula maris]|uniref:SRPBCC family protein n=1 Tax=Parvularcula maris TaxID=2965077 RepID=A0A9X2L7V3_9PROT|nr:SRPBCC family protein [Parvularcula maris]MCQ8184699.1 SRPBCC family protein [Parvularcula maris]
MKSFSLSSEFPFPADVVFEDVLKYWRLAELETGREGFTHFPDRMVREGDLIVLPYRMMGVKIFDYRIEVTRVDLRERILTSEETGGPIRSWRHRIDVRPMEGDTCCYTDRVTIDAGPLTPWIAESARTMYERRQTLRAETLAEA